MTTPPLQPPLTPEQIAAGLQFQQMQSANPQGPTTNPPPAPLQPIPTPATSTIAPVDTPTAPQTAEAPKSHPGPIKSLLSSLLYGAGQSLVHSAGLPTDLEKQTLAANQSRLQGAADDARDYNSARTQGLEAKAASADFDREMVQAPTDARFGVLSGQMIPRGVLNAVGGKLANTAMQNQGKVDVGQIRADATTESAQTRADAATKIAATNADVRKMIAQGQLSMAARRLQTAGSNLSLRQLEYNLRAYGTGADGKPVPGVEFDPDGRSVGTAMQANVRPTTNARNASERADTMQDLDHRIRAALTDPDVRNAIGPIMGRVSEAKQHAGILDPKVADFYNDLKSYGAFQAGLHPIRGIGGLEYFDKIMGGMGQSPEQLLGKLDSNASTSRSVHNVAHPNQTATPAAPSTSTYHPGFHPLN